jgi:phospholipid:diacylglycerol acyltransferase
MSLLRRRKQPQREELPAPSEDNGSDHDEHKGGDKGGKQPPPSKEATRRTKAKSKWSCVDSCCWLVGCVCSVWWLLLFLYNAMPASFPQYVTEAITGPLPDPPGVKLQKEGLRVKHPVVFVPGIVTGGLELWEGHQCAEGLFRKRLWGGTFGDVYKRLLLNPPLSFLNFYLFMSLLCAHVYVGYWTVFMFRRLN